MASVLVLGGGISGLSAGIYSLMEGFDVTICEKHTILGGNVTGWTRNGYHIDNCVHWLVGTNPHSKEYKMWNDLGVISKDAPPIKEDVLYTAFNGGKSATLYRDLDRTFGELRDKFPAERKEIIRFHKAVLFAQGLLHIRGKNHDKGNHLFNLMKDGPSFFSYYGMTVDDLKRKIHSPALQNFFSDLMMSPHFTVLFLVITIAAFCADDGDLPYGGSLQMALRMEKRFKELGGKVLTKKEAVKIHLENSKSLKKSGKKATKVSFSDGTELEADYIISAMDTQILFEKLMDVPMPKKLAVKYQDAKYKRFSSFHCAFACDTLDIPFEENYMFTIPAGCSSHLADRHVTMREFTCFPQYAPEGHTVVQTMIYCTDEESQKFIDIYENPEEYKRMKEAIAEDTLNAIETMFPSLKGHLSILDVWTPATYKRFLGAETGAWMGFTLPPSMIPMMIESIIPGVNNVLMASQWLSSPGGTPTAASAGKSAAKALKKIHSLSL